MAFVYNIYFRGLHAGQFLPAPRAVFPFLKFGSLQLKLEKYLVSLAPSLTE